MFVCSSVELVVMTTVPSFSALEPMYVITVGAAVRTVITAIPAKDDACFPCPVLVWQCSPCGRFYAWRFIGG